MTVITVVHGTTRLEYDGRRDDLDSAQETMQDYAALPVIRM